MFDPASSTEAAERLRIQDLLRQMLIDIQDHNCYYWVSLNYFEVQPPTERKITQWWQAPLFLDYDAIWNAELTDEAVLCEVILKNQLPAERERIKINFDDIYGIRRFRKDQPAIAEKDYQLYYDSTKFRMPPLPFDK